MPTVVPDPNTKLLLERLHERAITRLARACLQVRMQETRKSLELRAHHDVEVTPEHHKQLNRCAAVRQIDSLALLAAESHGPTKAADVVDIACCFFEANGMPYRLLEQAAFSKRSLLDSDGGQLPESVQLWMPTNLAVDSSALGSSSLLGVDRDALVITAQRFFYCGVRCVWFEKMLVEALTSAETFATIQEARQSPVGWHGYAGLVRTMCWTWAYHATRGESPKFQFAIWGLNAVLTILKLSLLVALAWISYEKYEDGHWISGTLGLVATGWIALNVLGRFVVQRVLSWARLPAEQAVHAFTVAPIGKVLQAMLRTHRAAAAALMSPSLVREHVTTASQLEANFDSVIVCFLDRATANNEHAWPSFWIASSMVRAAADAEDVLLYSEDE